jgi:hypothetical protein
MSETRDTKEDLINTIKLWLDENGEITKLKQQIKKRNDVKKKYTELLLNLMKNNEIDCVDIKNGSISHKTSKIKKQLNTKSLLDAINKYYIANNKKIDDDESNKMTQFIMDTRNVTIKESIHHKSF